MPIFHSRRNDFASRWEPHGWISGRLPFQNVEQCLVSTSATQRKLEYLALRYVTLVGDFCRAVGAADIADLDLIGMITLGNGGAALVESVSMGHGPKGLSISGYLFDSPDKAISFVSALQGNTYLEHIELNH
jgi:hypothetical protein